MINQLTGVHEIINYVYIHDGKILIAKHNMQHILTLKQILFTPHVQGQGALFTLTLRISR